MKKKCVIALFFWLSATSSLTWQDDIDVNLKNPFSQFSTSSGISFLGGAHAEVRLGRYLSGGKNHGWRGGAEGDVSLINFGDAFLWHMGLNMETLADDNNDIYFRLVQVYYQALTGVKWRLGDGVFHVGVRHRCSHGADSAEISRITIRSGMTASYRHQLHYKKVQFRFEPGINVYLLGQNRDFSMQPKGGAFFSAQAQWPLRDPVFMFFSAGFNLELVGRGSKQVYLLWDRMLNYRVEPLFASRLAIRLIKKPLNCDFALHFAQNLDTGLSEKSQRTNSLSFDIDFQW